MHLLKSLRTAAIAATLTLSTVASIAAEGVHSIAEGQLLRLDAPAHRLVIRTATGSQIQFEYTNSTLVRGAAGSVDRLDAGAQLSVRYERQETRMLATQVDVVP